ncbi:NAD(P)H-hydrate dehydratase [Methylobacterium soli]|uniref:ADP-dependent (S)-NAD(P)H-hydrate dehydratase n=1 Tax=Methylobacterium soli TaxID=553447 RepID=A0A6L3SPI8_9HYPH|nr:NAD(P)H-hydrate dehydratase [Methylobacterium soli]KAB1071709.1 NAD(P)H-hydrate dehydratase [Methylobacterium soli]GJE46475.1 Bifunctional NAD(P)H-hydrate repair enzyme Nnr [Methylobacterium soli]
MIEHQLTAERLRNLPLPTPEAGSKDERGSVLVLGGCVEVPGAVLLAGIAALRAGAGKLKIATVKSVAVPMALAVPEAMVIGLPETEEGAIDPERAEERVAKAADRCDAVLIGPGMTTGEATTALTVALLSGQPSSSYVLDAGALCSLGAHAEAVRKCGGQVVITPHAGEMAQLLDRSRDEVEADPLDAALRAAELLQAVVIMKGAQSWIVDPGGERSLYEGGGVGLATSGSGDSLAGIVSGLLARGTEPMTAALWGVYLHGAAGMRLAASCGSIGFLAREISNEVPAIMREVACEPSA